MRNHKKGYQPEPATNNPTPPNVKPESRSHKLIWDETGLKDESGNLVIAFEKLINSSVEIKKQPMFKQPSKEEIQDKQIGVMNKGLLFLWNKAKVNEKKTNELESKIIRMDEGCKDMWERTTLTMKTVQALDRDVQWIKLQNQIDHDREVELRQAKARKKAKVVDIIETVLTVIIFAFALVGVGALASGFLGV